MQKVLKKLVIKTTIVLILNLLPSCFHNNSGFITDQKEAWIKNTEGTLFYCKANSVSNSQSADPTCFEAGFRIYENKK